LVLGRSDYQWQHEPVLYGFLQNGKHKWFSDRSQTTVWNFDKPKKNKNYPTSKPLDLLGYPIGNSSQANAIVVDTFGGSGSTLMACEQMNRICYTMELDEKYASVILRRYVEDTNDADALFQKNYTDENFNRYINYGEVDQFYCENHHEAIISREDFDRTQAVLAQRAAEKGNGTNTSRYQNRYALSGRIRCGECGTTFKRRSHYKPSGDYIAWTCGKHIENRHACSMLYVEETAIHDAFVTMINKLVFGHQKILKPLLESLKSTDDKDKLNMIRRIDQEIENTAMQKQTLVGLAAQGILEPAIYNEECSALAIEEERLLVEKKNLVSDIGGDRTKLKELEKLMQFTAKGHMIEHFEDEIFSDFVDKIVIESRECTVFYLKCGLQLKERLVR